MDLVREEWVVNGETVGRAGRQGLGGVGEFAEAAQDAAAFGVVLVQPRTSGDGLAEEAVGEHLLDVLGGEGELEAKAALDLLHV